VSRRRGPSREKIIHAAGFVEEMAVRLRYHTVRLNGLEQATVDECRKLAESLCKMKRGGD
jgi:hypothetical protein